MFGVALFFTLGSAAGAYAVLDYRLGYRWSAGPGSVFLALYWAPLIVTFPLVMLLFPDGRLPPRWRWVFWSYLPVAISWPAAIYAVAVAAVAGHDIHILPSGDLAIVGDPSGSAAWLSGAESVILPVLAVFWLSFVGRQVASWRRADGEQRQQLKWLMSGAAICMAGLTVTVVFGTLDTKASPAAQSALDVLSLTVVALQVSIGVAILKYRLYDIDRIISRTLACAIVTGLLVGVYAGLVLLATQVLRLHAPVAVAAATLARVSGDHGFLRPTRLPAR